MFLSMTYNVGNGSRWLAETVRTRVDPHGINQPRFLTVARTMMCPCTIPHPFSVLLVFSIKSCAYYSKI